MSKTLDRLQAVVEAATWRRPLRTFGPDSVGGNNVYDEEWVVAYAQSYDQPTTIGATVKPETYLSFEQAGRNAAAIAVMANTYPEALAVVRAAVEIRDAYLAGDQKGLLGAVTDLCPDVDAFLEAAKEATPE